MLRLGDQGEGRGAAHRGGQTVTGLPGAEELLGVFDGDLDRPTGRVAGDHRGHLGGGVGADQSQVIAAVGAGLTDEHHLHRAGAEHRVHRHVSVATCTVLVTIAGDGELPQLD
jgi:hypothetical protein